MAKKKTLLSLLLAGLLILTACGSDTASTGTEESTEAETSTESENNAGSEEKSEAVLEGSALEDGVLDFGTSADFPPYEYYEGDQMVGIDVEIGEAIADYLGYELKMHDMEFGNIIASIDSGRLDGGMSGMTVTPKREESVNFSTPYTTSVQLVIVKEGSEITSLEDLDGATIGTQLGTTGDIFAIDDYGQENVQSFNKYSDAVLALQNEKVDALIVDEQTALNFVEANEDLTTLETEYAVEEYAIALSKDNEALLEEVNTALNALIEDGTVQEIIDKYITTEE